MPKILNILLFYVSVADHSFLMKSRKFAIYFWYTTKILATYYKGNLA